MNCPICEHDASGVLLSVKDYTVSNQIFELVKCNSCGFVFTNDPPNEFEIGKYYQSDAYISHTNSHEGFFNKIYQSVRKLSIRQKLKLIQQFSHRHTGSVLDYGCGTGSFLHYMKDNGWNVTGIEPDPSAQEKASKLISEKILPPAALSALESNHFDVVTLWHVLEHVHSLKNVIKELKRVLKKGSILVIAVPNHTSWDAQHYKEYWAAYDVPRHLYHFSPMTMHQLLKNAGFEKRVVKPMWFDAFYVSMLSEKYAHGKINMIRALCYGLVSNIRAFINPGTCSSQIFIYQKQDD